MSAVDLLAAATPRPWACEDHRPYEVGTDLEEIATCLSGDRVADAALIVAAVNEYEALLAVEANLRASIDLFGGAYQEHGHLALVRLDIVRSKS